MKPIQTIILGVFFLGIVIGGIGLALVPIHPPEQTITQVLADDRISH